MENKKYDIPIILFVFRRLDTVKLIVEKLREIQPRTVYIFSDGSREGREDEQKKVQEVREYLDSAITWECSCYKRYAPQNLGCAPNIHSGIDMVFSKEEKAVILEDDAVPMPEFFEYCRILLDKYQEDKRIQYIAGFNAVGDTDCITDSYTFGCMTPMSGAIATWADRWNECDFRLKTFPTRKKQGYLRHFYFTHELYAQSMKCFEAAMDIDSPGWDYQFHYDMLDKDRLAIVPRGNLVRSYGYTEGAFHEQDKRVIPRLMKIMDYTENPFTFPMQEPAKVQWNQAYDKLRQQKYLEVNGNYVERHIHYLAVSIKNIAYHCLPRGVWNVGKKIIKP